MGVDPEPICVDASSSGGGSCVGIHLDPKWYTFWNENFLSLSHDYQDGFVRPNGNPKSQSKFFDE
eukprot:12422862-Karenia_brevis.AAC.1